ncbi:MAG: thioredoxin domain-containing protein [Prevotella sp.]|nr:thioredoxin domain-containing protein [Prevotella sp.]
MKKTVAMFLLVFCTCWSVEAQTNFRKLSYDKALAIAKQEHKQVFIDFYTDWCGPCKVMARKVFPQKKLGTYLNERFVSIQLNAEKDGKEAAQHFGVNAYPTLLVVSPDGKEIMKRVGMSDTNDLISEIEWATNPDMTPQRMAQRYGAGERTPSLVEGYAAYLSDEPGVDRREARANSQKVVFDYFNGLTVDQRLLPDNLFVYTDYLSHFTDAPVQFMVSHRSEYPIEIRPTIDSLVSRIHKDEAFYYLLLMIPYDAEA